MQEHRWAGAAPGLAAAPQGHPRRRVAHAWGLGDHCPLQAVRPEERTWPLCPSPGLPVKQGPYGLLSSQTVVLNGKGRHTQSANCKGSKRVRLAHPRGLSQVDTPNRPGDPLQKSSCPTFLGNACWSRSDFLKMCSVGQLQPTEPERLAKHTDSWTPPWMGPVRISGERETQESMLLK